MLRFDNLCKRYGDRTLFEGLHFNARSGCFALNDESGSGKSTLLGMLAGEIEADAGEVWLGGHALHGATIAAKRALNYVPEDCLTFPLDTGRTYFERVATSRETAVASSTFELAERFGLTPHLEKRFEQMSFGTRKKFFLTAATIGTPTVVIADEPAGGLDAPARAVLADLFRELGENRVVFFTSYDAALAQACEAQSVSFADLATRS